MRKIPMAAVALLAILLVPRVATAQGRCSFFNPATSCHAATLSPLARALNGVIVGTRAGHAMTASRIQNWVPTLTVSGSFNCYNMGLGGVVFNQQGKYIRPPKRSTSTRGGLLVADTAWCSPVRNRTVN